jgi:drug/metabolite transporter (DMT)-like permease
MTTNVARAHRALTDRVGLERGPQIETTILFGLVVLVMGGGYVAIRVGVTSVPPLFLAALRFYLSAAVLLSVAVMAGRSWYPKTRTDWAAVVVLGLLVFGGAIGFLFVGGQYTTASTAAVVMCLGPVLTALIARVLLPEERLTPRQAVGVGFGLFGAVVVVHPAGAGFDFDAGAGAALVLCAAASGNLGGVLLGRLRTSAPLTIQAAWGALLGGGVVHAASVGVGEPVGSVVWTPALLGLLAYLAVGVGGIGYVAYLALLRAVRPTRTSLTAYASPVVTTLLGWLVLHEPVTAGLVVGFASIVSGFVLLNRGRVHTGGRTLQERGATQG